MVFPYLQFTGQCEEAFALYSRAFGGQDLQISKYGQYAPTPDLVDKVMHAEMNLGDFGRISGADAERPFQQGSGMWVMLRTSEENLRKAWAVLAEEGTILSELAPFEIENNQLMGTMLDKYGYTWQFTAG